jgi:hypothetical protein
MSERQLRRTHERHLTTLMKRYVAAANEDISELPLLMPWCCSCFRFLQQNRKKRGKR